MPAGSADRSMRSSPAPGTWTSFSRFAAAAISRVKARVTSTSTSDSSVTMPVSSPRTTSHGVCSRARTAGSSVAENVPAKATRSMPILPHGILLRSGRKINYPGGNACTVAGLTSYFHACLRQAVSDHREGQMKSIGSLLVSLLAMYVAAPGDAVAQAAKPNIVIIWGDDVGQSNISAYSHGMMGYKTPNIDRIAKEGMMFTDYYGEQSCTAGRAEFITGQYGLRTGMTKVGLPGATLGLQKEDPTIAELLKPLGYATGQFGKNHLGDRNEFLPTVHGFDEFYGNLYHLNAEEEPELPDYPKDPAFKKQFGPRGVLHCKADGKGGQTIVDTGPLTKKRMETIDEEITEGALAWMEAQAKADKPFFLWYNSTAMHLRTHVAAKNIGKSGQDPYSDRMVVDDEQIGMMLDKLDELGIADNTIVMYSTDNGPENDTWPDGGNTPFRS